MTVLRVTKSMVADLTVGDLEVLEERTGRPLSKLFDPEAPRGTLLHALAFVTLRKDNRDVTWEEAGDVIVRLDEDEDAEEVVHTGIPPTRASRRGDGRGRRTG
jgi:hypothetical protein